VPTDTRIYDIL